MAMRLFATAIETLSPRPGLPTAPPTAVVSRVRHDREWLWDQFRSTTPMAVAGAIAECAKFDSRSWVSEIDVPTSEVSPCATGSLVQSVNSG
jgi:3-oxoadipate enol-lactonase